MRVVDPSYEVSIDPLERLEARSDLRALKPAWDRLSSQDRIIFDMRFEGHTLKETGEEVDRCLQRVSQLQRRVSMRLRGVAWRNWEEVEVWPEWTTLDC